MPRLVSLPRTVLLAAALAAALPLAGCGEPDAVAAPGHSLRFRLDDYRIVPQRVIAPAGRLRIAAVNVGRLVHDLAVERMVVKPDGRTAARVIDKTRRLMPGRRDHFFVTLKPGTYRLADTFSNHQSLGQYGQLVVKER